MNYRIVAEAYFSTEIQANGKTMNLVKHNGKWVWKESAQISNLSSFPVGQNPLTNLLNGEPNDKFVFDLTPVEERKKYNFQFQDEKERIFVVDSKNEPLVEIPSYSKQPNSTETNEIKEHDISPYNLETLYSLADEIAVDE